MRVIDGLEEMDRCLVKDDALHPDPVLVRVDPVEGGVVPSGAQPDGTVSGGADVDAVRVTVTVCDRCVATVQAAPVITFNQQNRKIHVTMMTSINRQSRRNYSDKSNRPGKKSISYLFQEILCFFLIILCQSL